MNVSRPYSATIRGVDFGFLTSQEIRALSVKRIVHTESISPRFGHPIPGGLYDQALGRREDYECTTCSAGRFCAGHPGHIELPSMVYHPTFMDQLMKMLNAQCGCCMKFRASRLDLHLYASRLKLLRYGLVQESHDILDVGNDFKKGKKTIDDEEEASSAGEEEVTEHSVIAARNKYVSRVLKAHGGKKRVLELVSQKVESLAEERRFVIKELMYMLPKASRCANCKARSSKFKKDGFNKIFRQPMPKEARMHNKQFGFKEIEPLLERAKVHGQAAEKKRKRQEMESDEGIAMEADDLSDDLDSEDPYAEDTELTSGDLLDSAAATSAQKSDRIEKDETKTQEYVLPSVVYARMEELFREEAEILRYLYLSRAAGDKEKERPAPDMFFIRDVLVTPNKFRPDMRATGSITEYEQNTLYKGIITGSNTYSNAMKALREAAPGTFEQARSIGQVQQAAISLQDAVNSLIDTDRNPMAKRDPNAVAEGVKQKLEKKEGLFRMNMMGKRVNFAARSVISPDPNIESNEIGVPPVFAKKLTYPEPVTVHNVKELAKAVENGPNKWPGAGAVENEFGQIINLKFRSADERKALAAQLLTPHNTKSRGQNPKKVHRHLNTGDMVIMNRQPTLHKPSMMCHRARVLPGEKTIRMHYANCNTYNADFDGDEMNMHFPQNESARAEAVLIADTDHQYLSATAGKPLRGLIQDHLSMGVWLTNKDSWFDREDYHQLLYSCLRIENGSLPNDNILTLPPAIFKPKPLWSGKQLVSTVLRNIQPIDYPGLTMTGKSQVTGERWYKGEENKKMTEGQVIFKDGELLCGILDKGQLGPAKGGFIHSIYETYGHSVAGRLLGILGRMLTKLEHMRAFSCGMEDIVLTPAGNQTRREVLKGAEGIGLEIASKFVSLDANQKNAPLLEERLEEVLRDDSKQHGLDTVFNSQTQGLSSTITRTCLPSGLFKDFPKNQMQAMTTSGAKGSAVNANLISCNLGQQVLEGRRTPTMVSGKTLPAFKPFETSVRAGGYITNRFLTGVQPQEYYFHTMAGREGLIDTAVKTSRSGYLQRCIIKGMEGLQVHYDTSVRDADGSIIQFLYGEDGLDITKQTLLTNFKFQAQNAMSIAAELGMSDASVDLKERDTKVHKLNSKAIKKVRKTGDMAIVDPVINRYNPSSTWGSTSETFAAALQAYGTDNPDGALKDEDNPDGVLNKDTFRSLMNLKYMRSVIDPGEPVGIVAGQSIGEPSTQMTLNTFHLAGHSAKNVTLGIPRLREIVMTASANIMTPQMELHLRNEVSEEEAKKFARKITKLTLAEIIDDITVTERAGKGVGYDEAKMYEVSLNFFSAKEYTEFYSVAEEDVASAIEERFIPIVEKAIKKEMKDKNAASQGKSASQPKVGEKASSSKEAGENDPYGGAPLANVGDPDNADDKDADGPGDLPDENALSEDEDDEDDSERKQQQEINKGYDGDEDDAAIARAGREGSAEADEVAAPHEDEGYGGSPVQKAVSDSEGDSEGEDGEDTSDGKALSKTVSKAVAADRADRVISNSKYHVTKFDWDLETGGSWCKLTFEFDIKAPKILMMHLVEAACRKAAIQWIDGITSATIDKKKMPDSGKEILTVLSDGVNLPAMSEYQDIVQPEKIFSNDMVAMLNTYGVEAGRATLVREMNAVFEGHSISVDLRHLNLIGDHMTRNGGFLAFNRTGMKSGVSPFAKMSFETTVGFLKDALLDGDMDDLRGPSARIVVGAPGKVGTGAFDVLTPAT